MSTERDDIDLELKKIQLARERLALEDDLRARERKQALSKAGGEAALLASKGVKKAGEAAQIAAFSAGYLGGRTVKATRTFMEKFLHWAAVLGVIWIVFAVASLVIKG